MNSKTILFSIPHGQHARDLLRSHVLELILQRTDFQIVVLTPAVEEFRKEFHHQKDRIHIEVLHSLDHNRRAGRMKRVRDTALVGALPSLSEAWRQIERRFYPVSEDQYESVFRQYHPDLVIAPTPGQKFADIPVLWCARRLGIPSLAVVSSWDNLLTKGSFGVRPDYLAVWNSMMFDEAVRLHHYPRKQIYITGAPQFDLYTADRVRIPRESSLRKAGLDPDRKTLFITTAPWRATIDHTFILDVLLEAQEKERFSFPTQILCRLHPEDDWSRFKHYEGRAHFKFDFPSPPHPTLYWNPLWDEQKHLVELLDACDVNINVASTITLEACLADRPVVNVSFSPHEQAIFEYRIVKNHYGKHYKYVLDREGVRLARSPEELVQEVNDYLKDPSRDSVGRKKIADDFTYSLVGKSGKALADLIEKLALQNRRLAGVHS